MGLKVQLRSLSVQREPKFLRFTLSTSLGAPRPLSQHRPRRDDRDWRFSAAVLDTEGVLRHLPRANENPAVRQSHAPVSA